MPTVHQMEALWDKAVDRLAHDLRGSAAEHQLGSGIEGDDVEALDGIHRRRDDGFQPQQGLSASAPLPGLTCLHRQRVPVSRHASAETNAALTIRHAHLAHRPWLLRANERRGDT